MFVLGSPDLLVSIDHKLLVKIFLYKALEDIKILRLFSLKEHMLMYRFHIRHLLGRLNVTPDCASQYPASQRHIGATDNEKPNKLTVA